MIRVKTQSEMGNEQMDMIQNGIKCKDIKYNYGQDIRNEKQRRCEMYIIKVPEKNKWKRKIFKCTIKVNV